MNLFGRRPNQKRGSRGIVLLIPFFLIFAVLLVLTIVRWPGFDKGTKISNICVTAGFGLIFAVACFLLVRRTRRFYRLGRDASFPVVCLQTTVSRHGTDIAISFYAADEEVVRDYAVGDDSQDIFSDSPSLTQQQHDKLIDAYFAQCEKLNKRYSYQEFSLCDLGFLHNKKILCEKQLSARLFGNTPAMVNGNTLILYDQAQEWSALKEKWLNG